MYTKKRYSTWDVARWTRWETVIFIVIAFVPTYFYVELELKWLHLPWTPIALVGTALAFVIGFQNNAAYGRTWEARKIWGGIVNTSRTWGMKVQAMVSTEHARVSTNDAAIQKEIKELTYRHIAWLTALRHAMRQPRPWEVFAKHKTNREWYNKIHIPERESDLEKDLTPYLSQSELAYVMEKNNKPAALLYLQSKRLKELKEGGLIWEFSFLELENVLEELFTLQGKSERIKNFPYPRQYTTIGHNFVWTFILLLPFGLVPEFAEMGVNFKEHFPTLGRYFVWGAIPFCTIVSWVFRTMERIGRAGENPFEGTANDVPISTIARGIEIDLRQLLDENKAEIPEQFHAAHDVQM